MHPRSSELQAAYLGEIRGEAFFLALAGYFHEGASALRLLARLELRTGQRMASLLHRHGLPLGDLDAARAKGRERAREWSTLNWQQALERLEDLVRPFVEQYDTLAEQASRADQPALDALALHERALLDFTRLARQGRMEAAQEVIHRQLAEPA